MKKLTLWAAFLFPLAAFAGEFKKLPVLKLDHYAQAAPVTLTGKTLAAHERTIAAWLRQKHPDLDQASPEGAMLIKGLALMVKGTKSGSPVLVGKYYNQVIETYNSYPVILDGIAKSPTPEPFKVILRKHYANLMIRRGLKLDADTEAALLGSIPAGSKLVTVPKGETLAGHIAKVFPGFAKAGPRGKKLVCDYLADINPNIRKAGWYRTLEAVKEDWDHVTIPLDKKGTHVCLYRVTPGGGILLPPAAALEKIANTPPLPEAAAPGQDRLAGAILEYPHPSDGGLAVLTFKSDRDATLCDFTVVSIRLDDRAKSDPLVFAMTPSLNSYAHAVEASGLRIGKNSIKGNVTVTVKMADGGPPAKCRYSLDVTLANGKVSGSFTCNSSTPALTRDAKATTIPVAGKVSGHIETRSTPVPEDNRVRPDVSFAGWRGTQCNGTAPTSKRPLVDSTAKVRLAWRSRDYVPTSRPSWPKCGGGFASPVIADGRVQLFYYRPSGNHYNEAAIARAEKVIKEKGVVVKNDRAKWRIKADDVFHCIDASSGWTLWRTLFKEKGFSYRRIGGGSEKSGAHLTPCVSVGNGRSLCYAMGTGGNVYAVDAKNGEPVWQSDIGDRAEAFRCFVAHACKTKGWIPLNRDMCGCAVIAGDAVVCNNHVMYQGGQRVIGNGMVAFNRFTGKKIWEVPDCLGWFGSAIRWTHKGKEYFIGAGSRAVCVEPGTGKILWEIKGVKHDNAPAVTEDYLLVNGSPGAGITAYRITPQAAKKAWSIPGGGSVCGMVIMDNRVYALTKVGTADGMVCLDLKTGKTLASSSIGGGLSSSLMGSGGRIIREWGTKKKEGWILFDADPKNFRQLGGPMKVSYANSVTPTLIDGRAFVRGQEALYCYDLRIPPSGGGTGNDKAAVQGLIRAMKSSDRRLASDAVRGLGKMGSAAIPAVPALTSVLKGKRAAMWSPAATALARIGPSARKTAIATLAETLKTQKNRTLSTLSILTHIGPGSDKATAQIAIAAAARVLGVKNLTNQKAALECLAAFGPAAITALPALQKAYLEAPLREPITLAMEKIRPGKPIKVQVEIDDDGLDLDEL